MKVNRAVSVFVLLCGVALLVLAPASTLRALAVGFGTAFVVWGVWGLWSNKR